MFLKKKPYLTLKMMVKVIELYTVKWVSARSFLIRKSFPPTTYSNKIIDQKPIFLRKTLFDLEDEGQGQHVDY